MRTHKIKAFLVTDGKLRASYEVDNAAAVEYFDAINRTRTNTPEAHLVEVAVELPAGVEVVPVTVYRLRDASGRTRALSAMVRSREARILGPTPKGDEAARLVEASASREVDRVRIGAYLGREAGEARTVDLGDVDASAAVDRDVKAEARRRRVRGAVEAGAKFAAASGTIPGATLADIAPKAPRKPAKAPKAAGGTLARACAASDAPTRQGEAARSETRVEAVKRRAAALGPMRKVEGESKTAMLDRVREGATPEAAGKACNVEAIDAAIAHFTPPGDEVDEVEAPAPVAAPVEEAAVMSMLDWKKRGPLPHASSPASGCGMHTG